MRNVNAIGIAVSDLDFAFAMGTPVLQADPMRYYTLRASIDEAGLIGLEDEGLTAVLRGVSFEVNISTPTVSAFPVLPVIDWEQYALDHGCTAADIAAAAAGDPIGPDCKPFGVKTGRVDSATASPSRRTSSTTASSFAPRCGSPRSTSSACSSRAARWRSCSARAPTSRSSTEPR